MKQLIVSLVILSLYGLADVVLTAVGLKLGLREVNPLVPVNHLILHYTVVTAFIAANAIAVRVVAKRLGWEHIARTAVSLITVVYIYALIRNVAMIWRITNG